MVFTDLATTAGYPGRPESADVLLRSAQAWMRSSGPDLPCVALQLGFDVAGRPQLVLAVGGGGASGRDRARGSGRNGVRPRGVLASIAVAARECTICAFTESVTGDAELGDPDIALVAEARGWMRRHSDFAVAGSWLGHDAAGRATFVLIGDGATAVRRGRSASRPRLTAMAVG